MVRHNKSEYLHSIEYRERKESLGEFLVGFLAITLIIAGVVIYGVRAN